MPLGAGSLSNISRHLRASRGAIDGFDEGETAAAFPAVTSGRGVFLNRAKKIFDNRSVASKITDHGRRGALIFVWRRSSGRFTWCSTQTSGDNSIMFQDDRARCSGNLHAPRVARISRRRGVKKPQGAARKFENGRGRVLSFDCVNLRGRVRLNARYVTKQPQKQVDRVDALIDQRATAVKRKRPAPLRIRIVFRRLASRPRSAPRHGGC